MLEEFIKYHVFLKLHSGKPD